SNVVRTRRGWAPRPRVPLTVGLGAVAQEDHAVAETAFVQQLELQADAVGKRRCPASHDDGRDEQMPLADEPDPDRLGGEVGTADRDVASRCRLELPDRLRVEIPLDPGSGTS